MRYIGHDAAQAAAVQRELDQLQEERKSELKLARLTDTAKRLLRESKQALAPVLAEAGFGFHGYQIRRHSQLTDTGVNGQLTVTGQDGLSQGEHRLSMLLGQIDEPIFKNVFAIGMRELQELSTLDDTSAADELYKLSSGLDRVSLVDVLRSLRGGRKDLIGSSGGSDQAEASKLAA